MASPVKDSAWLEWMASLMGARARQTHTATLPPDRFHCLLDELPLHLIPRRYVDRLRGNHFSGLHSSDVHSSGRGLILNPQCLLLRGGEVPPELEPHRELLEGFYFQDTVAWVRDPILEVLQPFWLGPRLQSVVSRMRVGESVPDSIPEETQTLLAAAGVLISEAETEQRREQWLRALAAATQQFRERGYAPLGNLIHPFHVAALRRYFRYAIRRGRIRLGDDQSSRRYVAHNESVLRFFHHQITSALSAVAGEAIKASYVYLASYLSGAELKKHTDRAQCEFSVTLCLDFSPEPNLETSWPLQLDTCEGTVKVYQALGDGLVYRGTKVPHYRAPLAEGHTSTSVFFHYVPADFAGSLE